MAPEVPMSKVKVTLLSLLLLATCASAHVAVVPPQEANPPQPQSPAPDVTAITPQIVQPAPPPSPTATAQELERQGDLLRGNKMFVDAIEYYKAALEKTPQSSRDRTEQAAQRAKASVLYNKMGIAELQLQRYDESRKAFERAIKLSKLYAEAYNNLGVSWYMRKNYGKAAKFYRKAIELKEEMALAHNNLGTAYFARKEYPKAMAEYARALELDPDILDTTSRTGVAMRMSSPQDQAAYQFMIARLFAQLKDPDRCLLYLQKAIEGGYTKVKEVYKDQAFTEIRKDPRFGVVMAQAEASPVK
jgi:Tfp pilus assembly protein PilF